MAEMYDLSGKSPYVLLLQDSRTQIFDPYESSYNAYRDKNQPNLYPMKNHREHSKRITNDVARLQGVLQGVKKHDNFRVITCSDEQNDEPEKDLLAVLREIAACKDLTCDDIGAFICIVLGFGETEFVYWQKPKGSKDKETNDTVEISKMVEVFNGENCTALRGKPKLFFVQAETVIPVPQADGQFNGLKQQSDHIRIPVHADLFTYVSSQLSGDVWNNDKDTQMSRFVKFLCDELENLKDTEDIQTLVIRINAKIHNLSNPESGQAIVHPKHPEDMNFLPLTTSQLRKRVCLSDWFNADK